MNDTEQITTLDLHNEIRRLRGQLDDAAGYLAVIHRHANRHANRHDVLGANLACAGCALLDRIEAEPDPAEEAKRARQHEAVADIQDLTYELLGDSDSQDGGA